MSTPTATVPPRAGSPLVEAPSTEQIRTALVTAVLQSEGGMSRRQATAAVADALPGLDSDIRTDVDSLVLLGVLDEGDGILRTTELSEGFLGGSRLAAAG